MLVTGVANIDLWYPWPFFFPAATTPWRGSRSARWSSTSAPRRRSRRAAPAPGARSPAHRRCAGRRRFLGLAIGAVGRARGVTGGPDVLAAAPAGAARAPPARHRRAGVPGEQDRRRGGGRAGGHAPDYTVEVVGRTARRCGPSPSPSWPRCRSVGHAADRLRRGMERQRAMDGRARCALVLDGAGARRGGASRWCRCSGRPVPASIGERRLLADDDTLLALQVERRAARTSTTATRSASSHRTGRACSRRSGSPGWWSRERHHSTSSREPPARWFVPASIVGWAFIGVGVWSALQNSDDANPVALLKLVVGFDLVHDLVLAPLLIGGAWLITRLPPGASSWAVSGRRCADGAHVLFSPARRRLGCSADQLVDPAALDYGRNGRAAPRLGRTVAFRGADRCDSGEAETPGAAQRTHDDDDGGRSRRTPGR